MRSFKQTLVLGSASLCLAALLATGCAPTKNTPAPTGKDQTSESGMTDAPPAAYLDPAIEEAAEYLIQQLPNVDAVKASKTQLVLAIPPTLDHDASIPDGRLNEALVSLRTQLAASEPIKNNFVVVTATEKQAEATLNSMQSDNSAFRDPMQRTEDKTHAATYDPASYYLLGGKFYVVNDAAVNGEKQYKLHFTVENPQSRQQLCDHEVVVYLKWNTKKAKWELTQ